MRLGSGLAWVYYIGVFVRGCRRYECVSLEVDICAKRAENSTLVNSIPCSAGKRCLVGNLEKLEFSQTSDTLLCEEFEEYESYTWDDLVYECGEKKSKREFVSGKKLVVCSADDDCILDDGTNTTCQCGADGSKYCVPAWDSSTFNSYWTECGQGIKRDRLNFWILFKEFYPLWATSSDLNCIRGTIYEINMMVLNNEEIKNAAYLYSLKLILLINLIFNI